MFASPWKDTLVILVIVLLFVGPKRLPALSRSIGESIREFKGGISEITGSQGSSELSPGAGNGAATTPAPTPAANASTAAAPAPEQSRAGGAPGDQPSA